MRSHKEYSFKGKLWEYKAPKASWFFITLPKAESEQIKFVSSKIKNAWGSVKVIVTVGQTKWETSLFPDSKSGCYFLPIKKEVRKAENIEPESEIEATIKIK